MSHWEVQPKLRGYVWLPSGRTSEITAELLFRGSLWYIWSSPSVTVESAFSGAAGEDHLVTHTQLTVSWSPAHIHNRFRICQLYVRMSIIPAHRNHSRGVIQSQKRTLSRLFTHKLNNRLRVRVRLAQNHSTSNKPQESAVSLYCQIWPFQQYYVRNQSCQYYSFCWQVDTICT